MKPLKTSQQVMMWLCMCLIDDPTSKKKRFCYAGFTLFVSIIAFLCLSASIAFFVKNVSVDLESSLYAIFQIGAYAAVLNLIIVGQINRHRIAAIFTKLSKLCSATNSKSEWLWKLYFEFGMIGVLVNLSVSAIASIIYCFRTYGVFDADHLLKPFKLLFPWNQRTLYGYLSEYFITFAASESYMLINGAVLLLFISMCWYHQAFYQRFRHMALELDQNKNEQNVNRTLCKLIRFHISVKNWFMQSAEVYSPLVLVQLICNVIFMAAVVFELDLRMNHIDFDFEVLLLLNAAPVGVANLFMYCYFGKLATESYEKMSECLYESNWHERSPDVQQYIRLMIQNMQKPVVYHGFGVAILNLETFVTVVRSIFKFYMMFRTLTK